MGICADEAQPSLASRARLAGLLLKCPYLDPVVCHVAVEGYRAKGVRVEGEVEMVALKVRNRLLPQEAHAQGGLRGHLLQDHLLLWERIWPDRRRDGALLLLSHLVLLTDGLGQGLRASQ